MKPSFAQTALIVALLCSLAAGAAESGGSRRFQRQRRPASDATGTNGASKASVTARFDVEEFRIIADRNIFDPNRFPGVDNSRVTRPEPDRRVRSESFALVGTMSYEKGQFAFFDGSSSDYRKVLQPEGSIAGFKIASVAPSAVKLEATNGNAIELQVGMQMTKREDEDWKITERAASESSSSSASRTDAGSGGGADDVIKRMLQRREQEAGGAAPAGGNDQVPAPIPAPGAPAPAVPPNTTDKPASNPGGVADDALKRLLEKREQELNK